MRTVATTINPTTRELQVVAGLTQANTRGSAIPEERLIHNYLVEAGLAARIPKGIRIWERDVAGRRTDARGRVHAGGEGPDRPRPGRGPRPDDGRRDSGRLERGGARRPDDRERGTRCDNPGRGADRAEGRGGVHRLRRR